MTIKKLRKLNNHRFCLEWQYNGNAVKTCVNLKNTFVYQDKTANFTKKNFTVKYHKNIVGIINFSFFLLWNRLKSYNLLRLINIGIAAVLFFKIFYWFFFSCDICRTTYASQKSYNSHNDKNHGDFYSGNDLLKCDQCKGMFVNEPALVKHRLEIHRLIIASVDIATSDICHMAHIKRRPKQKYIKNGDLRKNLKYTFYINKGRIWSSLVLFSHF